MISLSLFTLCYPVNDFNANLLIGRRVFKIREYTFWINALAESIRISRSVFGLAHERIITPINTAYSVFIAVVIYGHS
jgi:hypothetical protein